MGTSGGGDGDGGEPEECAGVVAGDVSVSSEAELADLEGVGRIEGDFRISGDVRALDALACLEEIGGRLTIEQTALRDLSGLEGLIVAESLVIARNSELTTTKGLGLEQLLGEVDELSGFNSSLSEIVGNHQLTELRFDALQELGTIGIGTCGSDQTRVGNDALAALGEEVFPVLESAVTLAISSNGALRSVEGLVDGLARRPSFMLVSISDNSELDGPGVREHWESSGLDEISLLTCGNDGDPEVCDCPVTE
ncbi:MAG: hypothetical protein ACE37F_09485 [Nannocystaceae bacterium]|nr:hypothetical protein [bacterium]